jgi:hypothetical protein
MSFVKHVGRHGDQKVIIVFRKVPGEDHMCLVVYTDKLPMTYHDTIINVLESTTAQQSKDLSDIFHRNMLPDGRNVLAVLHHENHLKKVQTAAIIVTPNMKSSIRLDELNALMDKIETGGEAAAKLAELDKNQGLVSPADQRREKAAELLNAGQAVSQHPLSAPPTAALTDEVIANDFRRQASGMLAEAKRLLEEANRLDPIAVEPTKPAGKKRGPKPKVVTAGEIVSERATHPISLKK